MEYYQCCGCCSLRTGVLIVTILTVISGVISNLLGVAILTYPICYETTCYEFEDYTWNCYAITIIVEGSLKILASFMLTIGIVKRIPQLFLSSIVSLGLDAALRFGLGIAIVGFGDDLFWMGFPIALSAFILCYYISIINVYRQVMIRQLLERREATISTIRFIPPGINQVTPVTIAPGYGIYPKTIYPIPGQNSAQTAPLPPAAYPSQNACIVPDGNFRQEPYSYLGQGPQAQAVYTVKLESDEKARMDDSFNTDKSHPPPYF